MASDLKYSKMDVSAERIKFLRETMITFLRSCGIYMKQMWKASRTKLLKFIALQALMDDYNIFVQQLVSFRQGPTSSQLQNMQRLLLAEEQKISKLEETVVNEKRRRALAESMHEGAIDSLRTEEFAHGQTKMWLAHSRDHMSQIRQGAISFGDLPSSLTPVCQVPTRICHPTPIRPFRIPFVNSQPQPTARAVEAQQNGGFSFSVVANPFSNSNFNPHAPLPPNFCKKPF